MSSYEYVRCSTGDRPPANALQGGFECGPSYHARGIVSGKKIPGKCGVDSLGCLKGACIPYGGRENRIDNFEVLTCKWKTSYVRCKTGDKPPINAVQGGYDEGPSYHARGLFGGKRIPGKVGVNSKHDGDLKGACITYGGNENRIHDFYVLVIDESISHVEFKIDEGKMLPTTPKIISQQENRNDTSETQTIEFLFNETVTNSFTFTHQLGLAITIGAEFKCGVPEVCEVGGKLELTGSYSYTWGKSESHQKSFAAKFPVKAGPKTTVICKALVNETKLEVPYTVHLKCGNTSSGIWHGVSNWGPKATFEEKKD